MEMQETASYSQQHCYVGVVIAVEYVAETAQVWNDSLTGENS